MKITQETLDFSKSVVILITQWDRHYITQRCIDSIRKYTDLADVNILVLDDNSDSEETKKWTEETSENVLCMETNCHHNAIIRKMQEMYRDVENVKYLCAMNNDIIVTGDWLKNALQCMEENSNIALMGMKDNNDYHTYQYFKIPEEFRPEEDRGWYGDDSKLQEYVNNEFYAKRKSNACMCVPTIDGSVILFRNSVFKTIGAFDKDFDEYAGDSEFFIRVIKNNLNVAYCLSSFVYHRSGGGGGKYEGYLKTFNRPLMEAAVEKTELLKTRYNIDITSHGRSWNADMNDIKRIEGDLVRL